MPTIEEVDDNGVPNNTTSNNANNSSQQNNGTTGFNRIMNHIAANRIEAALWMTRLFTIFFAISFFLPFLGGNPFSYYQKCLLSNAISSALRLHQRVPNFQFTREYLGQLFMEDSAHYLLYSIIFLTSGPVSMALLPLFLYAVLHAQSYSKQLFNLTSSRSLSFIPRMLAKIEQSQVDILRFIACSEIFLMPMVIFVLVTGQGTLFLPFLYYRFLSLRYSSRRNPYCKYLFHELRLATEDICRRPQCPQFVRNLVSNAISLISRLAPAA